MQRPPIDVNEFGSLNLQPGDFTVLRVAHSLENPKS